MKSEFTLAFNEISERSKLSQDVIVEALEAALISAYRRSVNASTAQLVTAKVDPESGGVMVFAEKEVVDDVQDERTEVRLDKAQEVSSDAVLGDLVSVDSTPEGFGRIAAQTAKQVILQRIREAERESQFQEYVEREGDIVHGTVQNVTPQAVTVGLGRAEAIMPRNQQMARERYHAHDKVRAYVLEVRRSAKGPQIIVSRTHRNMLRRLLEMEVPEIYNGAVEIKSIAREPGHRSKVAVAALQSGVDPVGACVGMRGVRIQSIVRELNDEKIDVIEWNPDQDAFIAKALSPARVSGVYLDESTEDGRTATVLVPDDQLSLAIGREGQNARLAAKLTGWRIDIKSLTEAAADSVTAYLNDEDLSELKERFKEELAQAEITLAKKAADKPIMPEEYRVLTSLADQYERFMLEKRVAKRQIELAKLEEIREGIPPTSYDYPLAEITYITPRLLQTLNEAGYETAGKTWETLEAFPDRILSLSGVGPKVMENLATWLTETEYLAPVVEEVEPEEVAGEEELIAPEEAIAETEETADEALEAVEVEPELPADAETLEPVVEAQELQPQSTEDLLAAELALEAEVSKEAAAEAEMLATAKKKKKKKKKKRTVVYDDEVGAFITTRQHKPSRSQDVWDDIDEK